MNHDSVVKNSVRPIRSLDEIASEYERAEITCVLLHDIQSNVYTNLFSVVEMCPIEQEPSPMITSIGHDGTSFPQVVKILGKHRRIFIVRRLDNDAMAAIRFFRGNGGHRVLNDSPPVQIDDAGVTILDPPNEVPVVLPIDNSNGMANVLPYRVAGLRVCARLDTKDATRQLFDDKEFLVVASFVSQTIGVDLQRYREFLGATILCFTNPILRQVRERLSADEKNVLVELYPRLGKKLDGLRIELSDERPNGSGFTMFYRCESAKQLLSIPYSPYRLRARLFHPEGDLLWDYSGHFMKSFNINMGVIGPTRRLKIRRQDGSEETHEIQTIHYNKVDLPDDRDTTPEEKIKAAERQRELDSLEDNRTFIYFPPEESSVDKAKSIVRELLSRTQHVCFICDPYLSASDVLEFALFVGNSDVEVRLIGSVAFLVQKMHKDSNVTHGENLDEVLESIRAQDPTAKIQCRALKGRDKSPLHDRFIVVDEQVYILGSSLNEFGSRATTLFRVPNPQPLIRQAKRWWFEDDQAVGLKQWIETRSPSKNNTSRSLHSVLSKLKQWIKIRR